MHKFVSNQHLIKSVDKYTNFLKIENVAIVFVLPLFFATVSIFSRV